MKLLFIGGISSGKSEQAENFALNFSPPRLYIATADIKDNETLIRIEKHKKRRGKLFETVEEPLYPEKHFSPQYNVILIDCMTHFYNNIFYYINDRERKEERVLQFVEELKGFDSNVIMVTNEVGLGGVSANSLARDFADFSGWANKLIADLSDEVFFVISGIKLKVK